MKWFKHDSSANRDAKIEKVLLKYGAEGYALYWLCLELITDKIDATHASFELEHDSEILAARLKMDTLKAEEIMRYFVSLELFEDSGDRITCMKLAARLENSIAKNPSIKSIQDSINPGKSGKIRENSGQIRLEEIRLEENKTKKEPPDKSVYGHFENVHLTDKEHTSLLESYGKEQTSTLIEKLSSYKAAKGRKYKDDAGAIRSWVLDSVQPKKLDKPEPICEACGTRYVDHICPNFDCPSYGRGKK
jgi:hypothetical protein